MLEHHKVGRKHFDESPVMKSNVNNAKVSSLLPLPEKHPKNSTYMKNARLWAQKPISLVFVQHVPQGGHFSAFMHKIQHAAVLCSMLPILGCCVGTSCLCLSTDIP